MKVYLTALLIIQIFQFFAHYYASDNNTYVNKDEAFTFWFFICAIGIVFVWTL